MRKGKIGIRIGRSVAAWLLLAAVIAGALTGCGGDPEGTGTAGGTGQEDETVDGGTAQNGQAVGAMGRYVEEEAVLGGRGLNDWNSRIFHLEDGSLVIAVNGGYMLHSWDNGASWIEEDAPWLTEIAKDGNYILSTAVGADQTAAVIYALPVTGSADGEAQEDAGEDTDVQQNSLYTKLLLVKPDHTQIPVEIALTEDEMWMNAVYISDTGRIIVSTLSSVLYEVKEDGSYAPFLNVEEGRPELIRMQGNLMLLDGYGYEAPLLYDIDAEEYIEDEVLTDFVKENYTHRDSTTGKSHEMFCFFGEDDAIYIAGQKGLYRHVPGGSAMEQVIDGSLSILGNPANTIMDMAMTGSSTFLALLSDGTPVRFVYNPDIPAVPADRLKVYSLEDNATVRQVISLYQTANPSVYVEYEVGLSQSDSVTREDALKNLNTRIIAGEGPDVLVLDNMPADSYIEKGLLMDIAPVFDGMSGDEAIFPNVLEPFRKDGHVHMAPCEIQLPYLFGRGGDLDKMTDLSGIAGAMEDLRRDNPAADILRFSSPKAVMRIFSMACAPGWRTADGSVDYEAVSDFIAQTKRIYDAQMDGLTDAQLEQWEIWSRIYMSDSGEALEDSDEIRMHGGEIYFVGDMCKLVPGSMKEIDEYTLQVSAAMTEGFEDCRVIPMTGQCGSVFWARTLLGISASGANTALAQEFVKTAYGMEAQAAVLGGIPVNKKAILDSYADQRRIYGGNDNISGSICLSDDEGLISAEILVRVPEEDKVEELIAWIESADTAYVEDAVFESAVYEAGLSCMQDGKSPEEAVDYIEKKMAVYLAE